MDLFHRLNLIGGAPAFMEALRLIRRYSECDAIVLVTGETGTGKELAARGVHYLGQRKDRPFVPINCGAIPDSLLENELFGHARGAFTDGREALRGLVADAEGGTLFLDEVEALSLKAQVTLLRFLQDGFYKPLGARQAVRADVHVIAASNENLAHLVEKGLFRRDLMYRLQIGAIHMPPLRQRGEDIPALADHFLQRFARQYGRAAARLHPASMDLLRAHDWPGNVRELENLLHREFILCDSDVIRIRPYGLAPGKAAALAAYTNEPTSDIAAAVRYELGFRRAKKDIIEAFERTFVDWALSECNGNISEAARRCDKERRSFGRLLKKYGIDRNRYAG